MHNSAQSPEVQSEPSPTEAEFEAALAEFAAFIVAWRRGALHDEKSTVD